MTPLENLLQNAARSQKKIVLSEGSDPRAVQAAIDARADNIARIVLVAPEAEVLAEYEALGGKPLCGGCGAKAAICTATALVSDGGSA